MVPPRSSRSHLHHFKNLPHHCPRDKITRATKAQQFNIHHFIIHTTHVRSPWFTFLVTAPTSRDFCGCFLHRPVQLDTGFPVLLRVASSCFQEVWTWRIYGISMDNLPIFRSQNQTSTNIKKNVKTCRNHKWNLRFVSITKSHWDSVMSCNQIMLDATSNCFLQICSADSHWQQPRNAAGWTWQACRTLPRRPTKNTLSISVVFQTKSYQLQELWNLPNQIVNVASDHQQHISCFSEGQLLTGSCMFRGQHPASATKAWCFPCIKPSVFNNRILQHPAISIYLAGKSRPKTVLGWNFYEVETHFNHLKTVRCPCKWTWQCWAVAAPSLFPARP